MKEKLRIIIGVLVVLSLIIVFTFLVNIYGWDWTGFSGGVSKITTTMITPGTTTATPGTTVSIEKQPTKTLWDWLGLLAVFAIPVVVAIGAAWFTVQQGKVSDRENTDNQREAALQVYIDKVSELLLDKSFDNPSVEKDAHNIARIRTLTVVRRLDAERKGSLLQFLHESGLIKKDKHIIKLTGANLNEADLRGADLSEANLSGADLSGAKLGGAKLGGADLSKANLSEARLLHTELSGANLSEANLSKANLYFSRLEEIMFFSSIDLMENLVRANLSGANLTGANLSGANLSRAKFRGADLSEATLYGAKFRGADLSGATLYEAKLGGADLSGSNLKGVTGITHEQLTKAKSLKGATMPDGSVHS